MEPIIIVDSISRTFRSVKKEKGFKSSLKMLFAPEYSEHQALKKVSFEIEPGSFVGLIGANGAGKTTLLKILSGLIAPTSGTATVLGYTPFDRKIEFRKNIALVMGQKAQLWWDLPAADAFDLIQAIYEIPEKTYKDRLNNLGEVLDVQKLMNTQIRRLSLGERMKMELIGALLHWPKVVFLDEPTIGLDVLAAHKLREFLKEFNRKEKATIILTSHNMDDIQKLCSRVMILKSGEFVFDGTPEKLVNNGECGLRVRLKESLTVEELSKQIQIPVQSIEKASQLQVEESEANESNAENTFLISLQYNRIVETLQKILAKYSVISMGIEEQGLEQVIQRLFEEGSQ